MIAAAAVGVFLFEIEIQIFIRLHLATLHNPSKMLHTKMSSLVFFSAHLASFAHWRWVVFLPKIKKYKSIHGSIDVLCPSQHPPSILRAVVSNSVLVIFPLPPPPHPHLRTPGALGTCCRARSASDSPRRHQRRCA